MASMVVTLQFDSEPLEVTLTRAVAERFGNLPIRIRAVRYISLGREAALVSIECEWDSYTIDVTRELLSPCSVPAMYAMIEEKVLLRIHDLVEVDDEDED